MYFGQLYQDSDAKRNMYVGIVGGMAMMGGTIGAFVVMPFASNPPNGENFANLRRSEPITYRASVPTDCRFDWRCDSSMPSSSL